MAEYIAPLLQTVDARQNVIYTNTVTPGQKCIWHREGSGVVTLRGLTDGCLAKFRVMFSGNISVPEGDTVEAISLAIAINGEALTGSQAVVTPAAAEEEFNVAIFTNVEVPKFSSLSIAVENTTDQAINVTSANLIVDRIA